MNGTQQMTKVKTGAGVGVGLVALPVLMLVGKLTGSVLRVLVWVAGAAFVAGIGAYFATRPDEN